MKGELAGESVNYDTNTINQFKPQVQLIKKDTGFRSKSFVDFSF